MSDMRAAAAAPATTRTAGGGAPGWMTVVVAGIELALPIDAVGEVVPTPDVLPVPMTPATVAGVVSIRGDVVPVVDLGLRLLGTPASRTGRLAILALPDTEERVGLLVDAVSGLIARSSPRAPATPDAAPGVPTRFIAGAVAADGGRTIAVLDVAALLAIGESDDAERA